MSRSDLADMKDMLRDRVEDLCRVLLPLGRREGRLWVSSNPVTGDDAHEPALKVGLERDRGAWRCWRSGDKGDIIGLIAYVNTGSTSNVADALSWARDWLGLGRMSREDRDRWQEQINRRRSQAEADRIKKEADRAAAVDRMWRHAEPLGSGGVAELRGLAYFAARHVPLDRVPNLDRATFRFVPSLEWWRGAEWRRDESGRRRKVKPGPSFPAVVSAFRAPTGQIRAVHCTFLDIARPAKAPVEAPKLMFGEALGSVIRISHGPEGLPPEQAREPHPLTIGEGIETMLSVGIALPEARAWAGGSISGIAGAEVGFPFVSSVHPCAENDWNNPQALAQYQAAIEALEGRGKPVSPMRPHFGSDFNNVMQGG